ncbi:hypothetical protein NL676_022036, partial [Syzygium grande]
MGKLETVLDVFEDEEMVCTRWQQALKMQVPQQFYVLCQDISQKSFRIAFQMPYFQAILAHLLYRMRRSCLMPPSTEETSDPFEHLVATISHQSHLCPLPLAAQP